MKYKLVAVDMDGTLLNSNREVSKKNKKALFLAKDKGVMIVISTGRPMKGVSRFPDLMKLHSPMITYNGAMLVHSETGEVLFEQSLETEDAKRIIQEGLKNSVTMCIWSNNQLYGNVIDEKINDYKTYTGIEPVLITDYDLLYRQGITKILWYEEAHKVEEFEKYYQSSDMFQSVTCCKSMPIFLEFFNSKVSKGIAMEKIGKLYGIDQSEMIAIGDANNDRSMLEYAGLSVAMGNADENLKKIADEVTETNDRDGVSLVIEKFILTEQE